MSEEVKAEINKLHKNIVDCFRDLFSGDGTTEQGKIGEIVCYAPVQAQHLCDAINNYAELKENWNKATAELLIVKLDIVEKDAEIASLNDDKGALIEHLEKLNKQLASKDAEIARLLQKLAIKDDEILHLSQPKVRKAKLYYCPTKSEYSIGKCKQVCKYITDECNKLLSPPEEIKPREYGEARVYKGLENKEIWKPTSQPKPKE